MTTWNDKHAVSCVGQLRPHRLVAFCLWKTTLRNHKNSLPLATGSFGRWERFASEGARAHHVGMAWIFVPKVWLIYCFCCSALSEETKEANNNNNSNNNIIIITTNNNKQQQATSNIQQPTANNQQPTATATATPTTTSSSSSTTSTSTSTTTTTTTTTTNTNTQDGPLQQTGSPTWFRHLDARKARFQSHTIWKDFHDLYNSPWCWHDEVQLAINPTDISTFPPLLLATIPFFCIFTNITPIKPGRPATLNLCPESQWADGYVDRPRFYTCSERFYPLATQHGNEAFRFIGWWFVPPDLTFRVQKIEPDNLLPSNAIAKDGGWIFPTPKVGKRISHAGRRCNRAGTLQC